MKVLITGGCGFIGSHAVRHFVECGDTVFVLDKLTYAADRSRIDGLIAEDDFCETDICHKSMLDQIMRRWKPEVIINFAAETHVDNSIDDCTSFIKTNFEGASNLMTVCRDIDALYVHMSTDEVYGVPDIDQVRGFTEKDFLNPRNPYSVSKAAADMLLTANKNTYNQEFLAFRPSNNFGSNQHEEKFLPKLVRCLVSQPDGVRTDFPLYGDGQQIREWTYAPDTVRVMRDAINCRWRGFLNISSGISMTNCEMIDRVKTILATEGKLGNPDAVTHVRDRQGHDRRYWIQSMVNRNIFTPFDEALRTTVEHYFQKFA